MFKKVIASVMMLVMILSVSKEVNAQESKNYAMWENIMITPDYAKLKILGENLRKHNQKYHSEGPYKATVYNIVSGPNSGKLVWQMGPMMFKHNDSRPEAGGHDEDWRDNVMPYVKKLGSIEYWKQDDKMSLTSALREGGIDKYPIQYIRFFEVAPGHGYSINNLLEQIKATIKEMNDGIPWGVYDNQFRQGYDIGRHMATVSFFENWTQFDDDSSNFKETFEKVHGKNSWQPFIKGMEDSFSNSWDEVWTYNKNLSGD